jgi:hypothetical protein
MFLLSFIAWGYIPATHAEGMSAPYCDKITSIKQAPFIDLPNIDKLVHVDN